MSRYIDVDELPKVKFHPLPYTHIVPSDLKGLQTDAYERGWNDAIDAIAEMPTADVQKVVLCRDCKHGIPTRIDTVTGELSDERYCYRHHMCHFGDYYCADGERTENAMKCKDCKNYGHWFGDNYRCADSGTVVFEDDTCPYWHGKEGGADGS